LKKEQDEIRNSEDENNGNSTDFQDRIPPFFMNEPQKAQRGRAATKENALNALKCLKCLNLQKIITKFEEFAR
jgi:hypothetical protein